MENSISPIYQNLGHQGLGLTSPIVLVITANGFDLQASISSIINKLGLSTTGIPGKLHIPSHKFTGPGTNLFYESEDRPGRLNDDSSPKEWSKPINEIDQAAYYHDLDYYKAKNSNLSSDEILILKNDADARMIQRLNNYSYNSIWEKFIRFAVIKVLQAKIKFGMGLEDKINGSNEKVYQTSVRVLEKVKELHHRYKEGERRMVIVPSINHTHSCDIFEYRTYNSDHNLNNTKILTYIDCFSKKACVIVVSQKNADNIIKALDYAFNFLGVPKFLWSDNGKEFTNKLVQSFLKKHNVHWYSTYSELKAVIVERFNLTLREFLDKYKTNTKLKQENFILEDALQKFIQYYNNHYHRTIKMFPNDAHKEENETRIRHEYIIKYKLKHDDKKKYSVGDLVRIYKWKDTFTKKSGARFTDEVFKVREIQDTKPHTYLLEDLNGEEIKGSFYSFELISVASKN